MVKKPRDPKQLSQQKLTETMISDQRSLQQTYSSIYDIVKTYDWSVRSSFGVYNNQTLNQIFQSHATGLFNLSGLFADDLVSDDRIQNAIAIVKSIILDTWDYQSVSFVCHSEESKSILTWWKKNFFDVFDAATISMMYQDKLLMGFGISQIVYDENCFEHGPKLIRWHPSQVQYMEPQRSFSLLAANQTTDSNSLELIESNAKWQLFTNSSKQNKYYRCWISSGLNVLGDLWMKKRFALNDWSRYSEIYGNPPKILQMPADASEYEKTNFIQGIKSLTTEGVIPILSTEDGKRTWDLTFLQPEKDSAKVMSDMIDHCNRSIDIAILGTSNIIDGGYNAYGATEALLSNVVGAKPRLEIRFLEKDINESISNITEIIFGDKIFAPKIKIKVIASNLTT
jgi:phage gp29-like protein